MKEIMDRYLPILENNLSQKRVTHSINVAEKAKELAELYCLQTDKAYTAGLLHDIMKDNPEEDQLKMITEFGIILNCIQRSCPKIWHSFAGAVYVKETLKIADEEIFDAIACHTMGKANMTKLQKIIFLSDYTSADRVFPEAKEVRDLLLKDLDTALFRAMGYIIMELVENHSPICIETIEAYNQLAACGGNQNGDKSQKYCEG